MYVSTLITFPPMLGKRLITLPSTMITMITLPRLRLRAQKCQHCHICQKCHPSP